MQKGSLVQDIRNGEPPQNFPQRDPNIPIEENQDKWCLMYSTNPPHPPTTNTKIN